MLIHVDFHVVHWGLAPLNQMRGVSCPFILSLKSHRIDLHKTANVITSANKVHVTITKDDVISHPPKPPHDAKEEDIMLHTTTQHNITKRSCHVYIHNFTLLVEKTRVEV